MIAALAVMSVVLIAIGSAVALASRAMPLSVTANDQIVSTARITERIAGELGSAVYLTERTANAVTFTLADRDSDGLPEVIRYAWSETAGAPLTRQRNGGTAVNILEDVQEFELTYVKETRNEQYPGPLISSSETALISHDSPSLPLDWSVTSSNWIGQFFLPTLPAGITSWSVTRVKFMAKKSGSGAGETLVQLRLPNGKNLPLVNAIEQISLWEPQLTNGHLWQDITFNRVTGLAPGTGLCLVLEHASGANPAAIQYDGGATGDRLTTIDGGASWNTAPTKVMRYYVYGTTESPGPSQVATRDHVTAVRIELESGNTDTLMETAVRMLNNPEALTVVWDANFNADPTLMDLDLDATVDWTSTGSFDPNQLNNGRWYVDGTLKTNPANSFNELTTVDARLRDKYPNDGAGGIKIQVDRTDSTFCHIKAEIEKQPDSTQTLVVESHTPALIPVLFVTETGLPDAYVDLRILVDPVLDTLNIQINGQDRGTFQYGRIFNSSVPDAIEVYETQPTSSICFDRLRIRLGGNGTP